jgi:uncharacterized protein YacL
MGEGGVAPAAAAGATLGLLSGGMIASLSGASGAWPLALTALLAAAGAWTFVTHRARFALVIAATPVGEGSAAEPEGGRVARAKVIDTSALIDARLLEIAAAHFVEGALLLPDAVLSELQRLADGGDPLRRARGLRGLEVAQRLVAEHAAIVIDAPDGAVDAGLVELCRARDADLLTTDAPLQRLAAAQGVRVLNPHALAQALRAPYLPGEALTIAVVRSGREPGQGLGYLDDGTMVVIEGGASAIGRRLAVVVSGSLQTNGGRMLFAKPRRVDGDGGEP